MSIDITRDTEDKLSRQRWRFGLMPGNYNTIEFVLDGYWQETRESTRHKFRSEMAQTYQRIERRYSGLTLNDVPRPDDVKKEVFQQAMLLVRILVSDERGVSAPFGRPEAWY